MAERVALVPQCPHCAACLPYVGAPHLSAGDCPAQGGSFPHDPVEQVVARAYATYPTLFGRSPWSRWYIFDQLFFVVGGGFLWQRGELVDRFGQRAGDDPPALRSARDVLEGIRADERGKRTPFPLYAGMTEEEACLAIEREWQTRHCKPDHFYPAGESANIRCVPARVTFPWALAACDAARMFLQLGTGGQSMAGIYGVIRQLDRLCRRLSILHPALSDPRMTIELPGCRDPRGGGGGR